MAGGPGKIDEYNQSLTQEERNRNASKAGKASVRKRKEKKQAQQVAGNILHLLMNSKKQPANIEKSTSVADLQSANMTVMERILLGWAVDAMKGDKKAGQLLLQVAGELTDSKEISFDGCVPVMFADENKLQD